MPEQTTGMAAVVQSIECTGEGDSLAVLELQPGVECTVSPLGLG